VEKYEYGRIITLLNVKSRCTKKNEQMKILAENLNEPTIRDQIYIKILQIQPDKTARAIKIAKQREKSLSQT